VAAGGGNFEGAARSWLTNNVAHVQARDSHRRCSACGDSRFLRAAHDGESFLETPHDGDANTLDERCLGGVVGWHEDEADAGLDGFHDCQRAAHGTDFAGERELSDCSDVADSTAGEGKCDRQIERTAVDRAAAGFASDLDATVERDTGDGECGLDADPRLTLRSFDARENQSGAARENQSTPSARSLPASISTIDACRRSGRVASATVGSVLMFA
jgi:hypothetical protein